MPSRTTAARPRRGPVRRLTAAEAKARVIGLIAQGESVEAAMRAVERSVETYKDWRKNDSQFVNAIQEIRAQKVEARSGASNLVPDFPEFAERYLKQPLFAHQYRMVDLIEGRLPRALLPTMKYEPGLQDWDPPTHPDGRAAAGCPAGRYIVNLPPGHAKTTTISVNYITWLIHRDPNIKIAVVCKSMDMAKRIVGAVKHRLTSPVYHEMHARFAPEGGWKDPDQSWTATEIYVMGKDDGEKDPTLQALGIGSQIYGARLHAIFLDDCVTSTNVAEYSKQQLFIQQEVETRLDGKGLLCVLGTRLRPIDLYSELRSEEDWEGNKTYTYFAMPAVLDEGNGHPDSWTVLWPEEHPAKRLRRMRRDEATWALTYQQQDVSTDATFNAKAVKASINSLRFPGPLRIGAMGHPPQGRDGLWVVGGWDPAAAGGTAMIVYGVDRIKRKRYVIDGFFRVNCPPAVWRKKLMDLTVLHGINEWVIEKNGVQRILSQDPELRNFMHGHGCTIREHHTGTQKFDPDIGVMAMAPLFLSCGEPPDSNTGGDWKKTPEKALIELPSMQQNAWVSELVNELVIWMPTEMKQKQRQDMVMALWFCEIGAQRVLGLANDQRQNHLRNKMASRLRLGQRHTINLTDLKQRQREEALANG